MPKPPMRRVGWFDMALTVIEKIARRQRFMTSDDVWDEIGDGAPRHYNSMGAVMHEAISLGYIQRTGRCTKSTRPSRKGSQLQIHESRLYVDMDTVEDYERRHSDGPQTAMQLGA
jgi:hypothetical protein